MNKIAWTNELLTWDDSNSPIIGGPRVTMCNPMNDKKKIITPIT